VVSTIHTTKLTALKTDPHLQAAGERVKAAAEELERLGIADKSGKRVCTDLPKDMHEGQSAISADRCSPGCSSSPVHLGPASQKLSRLLDWR
jgi:hypothetical protein